MTAAVLVGVGALSSRQASQATVTPADDLTVVEAFAPDPDHWAPAIAALRAAPAVEAESLAAPGALVGLGVHDIVVTECGACSIGGLPTPLWNARAEHHVVGPGFFDLAGIPVVDGRGFRLEDGPGEEPVAIVSRRLANTAFEAGHAIGRRLRVGNDVDVWYRIVGVVEDRMVPTLGEDGRPRGAVYLSTEQHPLRHAAVLLRGDPAAVERAVGSLAAHGIEVRAARPAAEHLARAALPLAWAHWTLVALSLLSLVIAAHGVYLTALQTTRRQARDIGLRVALGASPGAIVRLCLVDRTRTTLWGLAGGAFLGALVSAGIQAASGAPGTGLSGYLAVGALLLTLSVAASWRAVGEALAVDPTRLLD
jgi:hypothetical protein